MNLRITASLFTLCLTATLFADPTAIPVSGPTTLSDLSATTLDEFTNAIDWTAGPNDQFNTQKNDFILGGLDFTSSTGNVGYYKSGNIPFAIRGQFAAAHDSSKDENTTTTDYPVFKSVNYDFAGTIGLPSWNDLSIGLDLKEVYTNTGYTVTTSSGIVTSDVTNNSSTFTIAVPVGFRINGMYNYGFLSVSRSAGETSVLSSSDGTAVTIFDKLRFQSLIKGGTETAIWAKIAYTPSSTEDKTSTTKTTVDTDEKALTAGISNRIDIPVADGINFVFDPFVSANITGSSASQKVSMWGVSTSSDSDETDTLFEVGAKLALEAKFAGTPLSVYAGVEPYAYLSTTSLDSDSTTSGSFSINESTYNVNLLTIVAKLPSDVSIDFTVDTGSTYKIECVIPLKSFGSNAAKDTTKPAAATSTAAPIKG